jgi:hypothetical protein
MSHDELLEEFVRLCLRLNAEQLLMVREILRRGLMPGRPLPDSYNWLRVLQLALTSCSI